MQLGEYDELRGIRLTRDLMAWRDTATRQRVNRPLPFILCLDRFSSSFSQVPSRLAKPGY